MKARQYAEALYRALEGSDTSLHDGIVERLVALMHARGHRRLLPLVVREYEKLERTRSRSTSVVLHLANEADRAVHGERIQRDLNALGATAEGMRTTIDETIIGGYAVEASGQRIDRTHKRTLVDLYSTMITNS